MATKLDPKALAAFKSFEIKNLIKIKGGDGDDGDGDGIGTDEIIDD